MSSGDDLEDIVRDDLRVKRIKMLLESTARRRPRAEIREAFEGMYQNYNASVIRLKIDDFLASVTVSDADLKKLYEERKIGLNTEELRKVKYVAFILPTTDKPLEGPARAEELLKGFRKNRPRILRISMTDKDAKFDAAADKMPG